MTAQVTAPAAGHPAHPAIRSMHAFIAAVESRDLDAIADSFVHDAVYGNVGHPPARGQTAIRAMFEPIVRRSSRIEWEIVTEAGAAADLAMAERVDRFHIDGTVYGIECNGVYRVDLESGRLAEVRDYVDLGVWQQRLGGVLSNVHPRPQR
jgi:limonene-1,2-epoxide hydrolase